MADSTIIKRADKSRAVQSRPAVLVEFPLEGEIISGRSYTFHIAAASGSQGVEVSVDKGEWLPCRAALGLWWCDWTGFDDGEHEVSARTHMGEGISVNSAPRRFSVARSLA
jgi:hypothetical protein